MEGQMNGRSNEWNQMNGQMNGRANEWKVK